MSNMPAIDKRKVSLPLPIKTITQSDLLAMRLSRPATAARRASPRRRLRDWLCTHPRAAKALDALAIAAEAVALGILGYAWFVIMMAM